MLSPDTRLGPYQIVAPLGAGGMGEVYRARDTRLGRDVAIKVLPTHLAWSPDARARFAREAKAISSLNHPNICTLFDVGREGDTDFLVMELVEGETLQSRLARGPLDAPELIRLGTQLADALDRAHRAGVVHRDLKPGNVMLTKSGAKLLDFGLARATAQPGAEARLTQAPTANPPITAEGAIVGTFRYMAPEQLEGHDADARSDLWALGCILYESATGRAAFEGRSQASLISAIMTARPTPHTQLAPVQPPALERIVTQCLAKEPDERWQTAHDVRVQLQWLAEGASGASGASAAAETTAASATAAALAQRSSPRQLWSARLGWALAGAILFLVGASVHHLLGPHGAAPATMRLSLLAPEGVKVEDDDVAIAISPDGRHVAFVGVDSLGMSQLWVRDLASTSARPLDGTQQAFLPFWSPRSDYIGFFADGNLKRVDVAGAAVQVVCAAPDGRGGAWSPRGFIVFAPEAEGGLFQVPEGGGTPRLVVARDSTRHEGTLRFPSFLPDGRHFLYSALAGKGHFTRLGSIDGGPPRDVLTTDGTALYAYPDHILYAFNGALLLQRFDANAGRVSGPPLPIGTASGIADYAGSPSASVSANGVILQRRRRTGVSGFTWVDRAGQHVGDVPTPPAEFSYVSPSPDGSRLAAIRLRPEGGNDLWLIDAASGIATRRTTDQLQPESPVWTPDGQSVTFDAFIGNRRAIMQVSASGVGPADTLVRGTTGFITPLCWSHDHRYLILRDIGGDTGEDIWLFDTKGDRVLRPLLHTAAHEEDAELSPDGHWLAYRSNESGRPELYFQSFPSPDTRLRVSSEGAGAQARGSFGRPMWRADSRELDYLSGDGSTVMSVELDTRSGLHASKPRPLFRLPAGVIEITAPPDLKRFLLLEERRTSESESMQLIVNWPQAIQGR